MPRLYPKNTKQPDRYASSWTVSEVIRIRLWSVVWLCLFRPTPKCLNGWRLFLLQTCGAKISGRPFVYSSARVFAPFLLTLEDHACLVVFRKCIIWAGFGYARAHGVATGLSVQRHSRSGGIPRNR